MGDSDKAKPSGSRVAPISPELQLILQKQQETILQAVNSQISGLQTTLLQQQAALAQEETAGESYTFKKKGNEEQYKFNKKVLKANSQALRALDNKDLSKAREQLNQGIVLLNNRQKLVKLADKSEFGWATIQEYVDDELADNESDARKIKKAEKRASARIKSNQEKKKKANPKAINQSSASNFQSRASSNFFRPQYGNFGPSRSFDMCFKCGRRGHWAESCSRNKPASTSTSNSTK